MVATYVTSVESDQFASFAQSNQSVQRSLILLQNNVDNDQNACFRTYMFSYIPRERQVMLFGVQQMPWCM